MQSNLLSPMPSYQDILDYLYASQPAFHNVGAAAYKPGLINTCALMEHLGNPHTRFQSIHIAGTNGKGSTSHLIAAALQCAGLKVGLYTSPHLVDFRERIRINGQTIPQEAVIRFVTTHRAFLDELQPSFFESTMAMAFDYFAQEKVDIAVVEVGLGGRLDSTNIITPLLSVITNIGLDHTEFLGNTLPQIAAEKAGIIKPHIPCVIGETDPETEPVFLSKAQECDILGDGLETTNCRLWFADQCGYLRRCRLREAPSCELHGIYQDKNQQTAYVALKVLNNTNITLNGKQLLITPAHIADGFAQVCQLTGLRGRWEMLSTQPLTICDTGHNSHGIRYVVEQLNDLHRTNQGQLRIVFGMVNDKDVDVVLTLLPHDATYYFTQAQTHRAIPAEQLLSLYSKSQITNHQSQITNQSFSSVQAAIQAAQADASPNDIIFIGGSNYVVGEALSQFS